MSNFIGNVTARFTNFARMNQLSRGVIEKAEIQGKGFSLAEYAIPRTNMKNVISEKRAKAFVAKMRIQRAEYTPIPKEKSLVLVKPEVKPDMRKVGAFVVGLLGASAFVEDRLSVEMDYSLGVDFPVRSMTSKENKRLVADKEAAADRAEAICDKAMGHVEESLLAAEKKLERIKGNSEGGLTKALAATSDYWDVGSVPEFKALAKSLKEANKAHNNTDLECSWFWEKRNVALIQAENRAKEIESEALESINKNKTRSRWILGTAATAAALSVINLAVTAFVKRT